MMGIVVHETCWAYKKHNKVISGIYLVFLFFSYHNDARTNRHQISIYSCQDNALRLHKWTENSANVEKKAASVWYLRFLTAVCQDCHILKFEKVQSAR